MKKTINIFAITVLSLFFISCSNMTIGFEEDSPLYNGPLIDTREDVNSEKASAIQKSIGSEENTQNAVAVDEIKVLKSKEENIEVSKEIPSQESQTTFSYERDDE